MKKIFYFILLLSFTSYSFTEEIFFWKINTNQKVIFLTFDDGPGEYTKEVLKILKKYNIKATFFVLGELVEFRKDILKNIINDGHQIGSHTYSHKNFYKLDKTLPQQKCEKILEEELSKTESKIKSALGSDIKIKYLRMPNGFYRKWMNNIVRKFDYKVINWTHGCDWLNIDEQKMLKSYINALQPGGIYLFHDGGKDRRKTIKVLEEFIKHSLNEGYKFDLLDNWVK